MGAPPSPSMNKVACSASKGRPAVVQGAAWCSRCPKPHEGSVGGARRQEECSAAVCTAAALPRALATTANLPGNPLFTCICHDVLHAVLLQGWGQAIVVGIRAPPYPSGEDVESGPHLNHPGGPSPTRLLARPHRAVRHTRSLSTTLLIDLKSESLPIDHCSSTIAH